MANFITAKKKVGRNGTSMESLKYIGGTLIGGEHTGTEFCVILVGFGDLNGFGYAKSKPSCFDGKYVG